MQPNRYVFVLLMAFNAVIASARASEDQIVTRTMCVAHRGLSSKYLENSFVSFDGAIQAGAYAVELDLRHSKDGVGFIMHDADLSRTATHKEGHVCPLKTKLSELRSKDVIEHCQLNNGENIPTLAALFDFFSISDPNLFLEFKDRPSNQSIALIQEWLSNTKGNQTLISFSADRLQKVKERLNIKSTTNIEYLHLAHFQSQADRNFDGFDLRVISKKALNNAKDQLLKVGVWTKDRPSTIRKYLNLGVDYITTNRVDLCLNLSKEEGPTDSR